MTDGGRLAGRTCLVTGTTGMAAAAASRFAAEGASVFVVSRSAEHARDLAATITASGGRSGWAAADLSAEADAESAVSAVADAFGRIDGLYAVAGISGRRFGDGPVHEASLAGWRTVMDANATSTFLVCRAVVRRMLAQDRDPDGLRGAILTMSSVLATHPVPDGFATHAYAASKGAIEALTRSMAAHYAADGIRANAIAPGLVATPMSLRAQGDPAILAYLRDKQPLAGGPIDADDTAELAVHLLGREARRVTGQVIEVGAGWSLSEPRVTWGAGGAEAGRASVTGDGSSAGGGDDADPGSAAGAGVETSR
jgi:NAD(P)-dependent dehydrogenase (short-subunit alcohol dehydrogenase family)